jgi:PAS domain S-box-containing protein
VRASTIEEVRLAIPEQRRRRAFFGKSALFARDLGQLLDEAVRLVAEGLQADVTRMLEPVEGSDHFRVVAGQGGPREALQTLEYTPEQVPLVALAMRSERPVRSHDMRRDSRFDDSVMLRDGMSCGLATVIRDGQSRFGVLAAYRKTSRKFDKRDIDFIQQVANLLAIAIGRSIAEARLAESEQRYRLMADNAPDVIYRMRLRPDRAYEYVSPATLTLTGYTPEELYADPNIGMTHIPPDDRETLGALSKNQEAWPNPTTVRFRRKDGRNIWLELRNNYFRNSEGELVAVEGIARDITVRVREERLNQIELAVDEAILAGTSATQVLRRLIQDVRRLTEADHASYLVPADGPDSMRMEVADGLYADQEGHSVSVAGLALERALSAGEPIVTGSVGDGEAVHLLPDATVGSAIMMPVRTAAGSGGVLVLANRPGQAILGDTELDVLGRLSRRAAVAIEYRRAHDELQRVAVLDDRARIARDLHDGIIQSLFAASMVLNQVRELEQPPTRAQLVRLERLIGSSIEDLRRYVRDLTPPALSSSDLGTVVRQLVRDFQERTGIRCRVSLEPRALASVQRGAVDIVQIIRESLSNIARHASASDCTIRLRRDGEQTTLEIRDDGRGLHRGQRRGFGLKNIVSRARFLGGEAAVTGEPGAGTLVRVILPRLDTVALPDTEIVRG